MKTQAEHRYAVYAEAEGHERPLLQVDLTFARLMDDIVVPYHSKEPFFIDGAPLTASKLTRIKLLRLGRDFDYERKRFNRALSNDNPQIRKLYGEQYTVRFQHLLREYSEDVTSQVVKAFNHAIKPSLKDYLPKREELISAALKLFVEGVNALGS